MMENNLRVLQVNLNKSAQATESTLQSAVERAIDLIIVQEPWLVFTRSDPPDYSRTRSVNHSSYVQILPPSTNPGLRPRVLIYVLKTLKAQVNPLHDFPPDPDFMAIQVKSRSYNFTLWNLYHEKDQMGTPLKTIERILIPRSVPPSTIILGDFNTHHPWWDPHTTATSSDAESLVEWIENQDLALLNSIGTGTFFRPNMTEESVLDLTFATRDLVSKIEDWQVLPSVGSDHHGILFAIQDPLSRVASPLKQPRFKTLFADWGAFGEELAKAISQRHDLSSITHTAPAPKPSDHKALLEDTDQILAGHLDRLGEELTDAIAQAAHAALKLAKPGPRSKPWWNESLKEKRQKMLYRQREFTDQCSKNPASCFLFKKRFLLAKNDYFHAIKTAKRDHWNAFLEKETPQSIYKAMAYTKENKTERIPQIQSGDTLEDTFEGKCSAFKNTLFPPLPTAAPVSWDGYTQGRWEWPELTYGEVEKACSSAVKSSTPGPDAISQNIISTAFKYQPQVLFKVFSTLFNYGYHPTCWKQATGAILKKPGKPDYSAPKAYRVIALLNCLGKVNERILAKRLAALAEITNLLHPSQIGGRKQKSAIDAVALLTDKILHEKQLGRVTSTLFLDVKGAFDHVALNQLLAIMQRLKLPLSFISWVRSFLNGRQLRLSFDGQTEEFSEFNTGIPQGSPISPILFLIYTRELFESTASYSLSYIDDLSLTVSSTSLKKNVRSLQRDVGKLFQLGATSGVQFDAAKTDLIHFTKSNQALSVTLTLPDGTVVTPKKTVKWLGIHLDRGLSFKEHVTIRTGQARSAFHRLCRLANIERGLSPFAIRLSRTRGRT